MSQHELKITIIYQTKKVSQQPLIQKTHISKQKQQMDISEVCNLCNKPNDQMLMLKCVHDPCVNCAASTYAEQIHIKGQSNQIYVCEICGQHTLLDNTTVQELTNLANTFVKSPTKYTNKKSIANATASRKPQPLQSHPSMSAKKVVYYCKDHAEEQVTYYCFNCWQNICPECAIHGNHKDHKVKMIKKAISQVKNVYMQKIGKLTSYQTDVVKGKQGLLRTIKSVNDRHVREKHAISKEFESLRQSLIIKQKELLKQLDEINRSNIQTLTAILEHVNKNYEESNKLKRTVEMIMKKDDVLVLEDYKGINEIEEIIIQLSKETQSIEGKISALNPDYLVQDVKQIAESSKKIVLKLEDEKIGLVQYLDYTNSNVSSRMKGSYDR